jgi:hypothetical protein
MHTTFKKLDCDTKSEPPYLATIPRVDISLKKRENMWIKQQLYMRIMIYFWKKINYRFSLYVSYVHKWYTMRRMKLNNKMLKRLHRLYWTFFDVKTRSNIFQSLRLLCFWFFGWNVDPLIIYPFLEQKNEGKVHILEIKK